MNDFGNVKLSVDMSKEMSQKPGLKEGWYMRKKQQIVLIKAKDILQVLVFKDIHHSWCWSTLVCSLQFSGMEQSCANRDIMLESVISQCVAHDKPTQINES